MNRIAIALAIARGELTPERGADLLAKSAPSESPVEAIVKGGSWVDIPGDEHGGEQKLYQDRFIRRWPDAAKARAAATRYEKLAAQAAVARDAAEAAGTAGSGMSPYNGAEWRHRELARYAAEYAELLGKGLGTDDDLFKAMGRFDAQEVFADVLAKGGEAKPPSGYSPVPGGAHGGYRKKTARGWSYWYPDSTSAQAAATHHATESRKEHKRYSDAQGIMARNSSPTVYHQQAAIAGDAKRKMDEHAEHAAGSQKFVDKQSMTRRILDEHADQKRRKEEGDKLPETPPEGKHYIAERGGVKRQVDTVASHGHYHVHGEATPSGLRNRGNSDYSYTVTHGPSGLAVGHGRTKADAVAQAKHFHEHAGDAGKDTQFGESPAGEDMKRMGAAYEAWVKKKAKKAMDDWQPINATPDQLGVDLTKGFAGFAGPDHMGVRPDAFRGVREPQLRKGGGDTGLRGVGAGFDPRWNGGDGFGQQG